QATGRRELRRPDRPRARWPGDVAAGRRRAGGAFRYGAGGARHRARDWSGAGAALCDRSVVADPDRPVDRWLARRLRQLLKRLVCEPDQEGEMRKIFVIGIGVGDPDQVTIQAIKALNQVDVFFIPDKGTEKAALRDLRTAICERFIENADYRTIGIDIPQRATAGDYLAGVDEWHGRLADIYGRLFEQELEEDEI